jgi:hypothetical protein
MGYRSDVSTVIYGDDRNPEKYALLKTLMNTTFKVAYDAWSACAEWHDTKHVLEFQIEDVKWYESYPEVMAFLTMLENLREIEGYNYEFVRVGEDDDDIDRQSEGNQCEYLINVCRSIEVEL